MSHKEGQQNGSDPQTYHRLVENACWKHSSAMRTFPAHTLPYLILLYFSSPFLYLWNLVSFFLFTSSSTPQPLAPPPPCLLPRHCPCCSRSSAEPTRLLQEEVLLQADWGLRPTPYFWGRPSMVSGPTAPGPSWTPDTSQGPSQPLEGGGWRLPWAKAWFSLLLWARAFASFSTDAKKASNSRVITHIKKKNPNSIISSLAQIQRKATLELQSHISHASTCARAHAHTHVLRQPKWHFLNLTLNGSLCDDDCLCFKFELCLLKASFFEDRLFCSIWHNELLSWAAKTIWIPWAAKINWMLQNNWIQLQKIGQEKTEKNVWLLFPQTTGNRAGWSAGLCPWLVCKPRCYNLMVWKL